MAENTGATGSRSKTWLWMLLAVVVVAGFLTWLGMASEPSAVAVVEEDPEEQVDQEDGTFVAVPRDTLAANKARYQGQVIRVPDLQATGGLGSQVFWGELGTPEQQVPILVRLDSALVESGTEVESGQRYQVTGLVQEMTDEVAAGWLEEGVLPDEGAEAQATFADYYIVASRIRPAQSDNRGSDEGDAGNGDA